MRTARQVPRSRSRRTRLAASLTVFPRAERVASAGSTTTEPAACTTVTTAVPEAAPALAVIVAVPLPTAVTRPVLSTVATAASSDSQANCASGISFPLASNALAASLTVSPRTARVNSVGPMITESAACNTVTAAVPEAAPALAVIVADPLPEAVTRPEPPTVATADALDAHVTAGPRHGLAVLVEHSGRQLDRLAQRGQPGRGRGHGHGRGPRGIRWWLGRWLRGAVAATGGPGQEHEQGE